jgi:SAM-dependent methyltransferase
VRCRHCGLELSLNMIDLGITPLANAYLSKKALGTAEKVFPLRVLVCEGCWLAQTEDYSKPDEIFEPDYAYFSGYSSTWVEHCRSYSERMIERFSLGPMSSVVEVASNDGTLLRYFFDAGMNCTGIEPTLGTAEAARGLGLKVVTEFLTYGLAERLRMSGLRADLLVANNVLAHVPDVNDFAMACAMLLSDDGVATFEFPHLHELIAGSEFDTIYHEHYSYLSLLSVESVFSQAGLAVFDVEQISTHGGSLRVYAQRSDLGIHELLPSVSAVRDVERDAGLAGPHAYSHLQVEADRIRDELREFLLGARTAGRSVAAYGAAAKGNTLLNYAGVDSDLVMFVVDRNPAKQGKFLPGSRIEIVAEDRLVEMRPDYILVLPWNLLTELRPQLSYIAEWSGAIVTAVPELTVW